LGIVKPGTQVTWESGRRVDNKEREERRVNWVGQRIASQGRWSRVQALQ
jgi:hypothetical protein